jgi:hypothetical protein
MSGLVKRRTQGCHQSFSLRDVIRGLHGGLWLKREGQGHCHLELRGGEGREVLEGRWTLRPFLLHPEED